MNRTHVLALSAVAFLALATGRCTGLEQQNTSYLSDRAFSDRAFNPAISVILDGRYAHFEEDPLHYRLPGFQLGGEAGLGQSGFSLGHSEVAVSASVDDKFYGNLTAALHAHGEETHVELEEAYLETIGLGHGLTLKAGRFLSAVGYLNETHEHNWDFADAPLVYRALFGNHVRDDGLQLNWMVPTDVFAQVGGELLRGQAFPAAGAARDGIGAHSLYVNLGGDVGMSHGWQAGVSYWCAEVLHRASTGHSHAEHSHDSEATSPVGCFSGDSRVYAFDLVWKWAPDGNPKSKNLKLQFEYFDRSEEGTVEISGAEPPETSTYDGSQTGWYAQAAFQFIPQWRIGARFDHLRAENSGSDEHVLTETGLADEGARPQRIAVMLDWSNSEFSRIRLQYNYDKSSEESDHELFLQYTMSLGSHGAHQF